MIASVILTLSLFGYVAVHAITTPGDAPPEVSVVDQQPLSDDRTLLKVQVSNPGSTGFESVTVSASCSDESLRFQHMPTDARQTGIVVCPASTDDPSVSVQTWIWSKGSRVN